MLNRRAAEHLLFSDPAKSTVKRHPMFWYRMTEVMPATLSDSHLTVWQIVSEMRQEEKEQDGRNQIG